MEIKKHGLLLLGCGKMGGALLRGWLASGLTPGQVSVVDPHPGDWLQELGEKGLLLNVMPASAPDIVVVATKPQIIAEPLRDLSAFGGGTTLFISIAAGTPVSAFEEMLGDRTPVVRTMPNLPAAIGAGMTALFANRWVGKTQMAIASQLMEAVGQTVTVQSEEQMHAVTALSGSGPAYFFALTEALAQAGTAEGLPPETALKLAVATAFGAGQLMMTSEDDPTQLRTHVTSPNGTTQAGVERLMQSGSGIFELASRAVSAAKNRSQELAKLE